MRYSMIIALFTSVMLTMTCTAQATQPGSREEDSIKEFLQNYLRDPFRRPDMRRYVLASVDLNDDGVQEAIVYLDDVHSCGSGGCTTLILARAGPSYKVVTKISIAWTPIRVLKSKSNGWHDIAVQVYGGGVMHAYQARLCFDGKIYPSNPTLPPARRLVENAPGRTVISSEAEGQLLYQ